MELLLTLYALVVLQLSPDQVADAFKQLKSKGNAHFIETIPGLEETIQGFLSGNEDFVPLLPGLKAFIKAYEKKPTAKVSIVALLRGFVSYMASGNDNAFKRLEKAAANEHFPAWISQNIATQVPEQGPLNKKLIPLVKYMGGKKGATTFETPEEAKAAKEEYPEQYAEWQQLRKLHSAAWKGAVADFVKKSGKKTVPYQNLMKYLNKNGIETTMSQGFTGNIDAACQWYSPFDELLTGVPQTAVFPTVRMNPNYKKGSTEYVCVCVRRDKSEGGWLYTMATKHSNSLEKFKKVQDFSGIVTKVRAKWVQQIMKGEHEAVPTIACVILELLFEFSARIGSSPTKHNGLSSLTLGHYTDKGNGFILKYLGKDGVPTKHTFVADTQLNKRLYAIVKILANQPGKTKKDFLFTTTLKNGKFSLVRSGIVTRVFRQCGAGPISVHKLRTFHATELMKKELAKVYEKRAKFKNTKEAFEVLKILAMKVGKDLNHVRRNALGETSITPTTSLANYIDVSLQVAFFQHYQLPVPRYLEKYVASPRLLLGSYMVKADDGTPEDDQAEKDEERVDLEEQRRAKEIDREHDKDEDGRDDRIQEYFAKEAEKIGDLITKGGGTPGDFSPAAGQFDNRLV